jgi:hypothetical protein
MILPPTQDRAVVVFHLWPSLAYGRRLAGSFAMMATGIVGQILTASVLPGILLIALGTLLLLVRGYDNRVDQKIYDPAAEWERVEIERLAELRKLHREMRRWDASALDVTNKLGAPLFILIAAAMGVTAWLTRGPLQILVIDAMVLLLPHWLTGIRSILVLPNLMVRVNLLDDIVQQFARELADHKVHLLMLLRGAGTKIPDDVKLKVDIKGHDDDFLGMYVQVVVNEVQGSSYPYLYVVLVARREYGLVAAHNAYSAPPDITTEFNLQDNVEVLVLRQTTTDKSGYHTGLGEAQRILSEGLALAERVAVRERVPG